MCSLCLILQVVQCFLDLGNLPNKITEHKAFPVPSTCVMSCCIHLMFLLLLFFFCSACASCLAHCESIIGSTKTNTKIISIQHYTTACRGVEKSRIELADGILHSLQLLCYLRATKLCQIFNKLWLQLVKKSFGDQSQAIVPCPLNLGHMFKNKSLHFKLSSR